MIILNSDSNGMSRNDLELKHINNDITQIKTNLISLGSRSIQSTYRLSSLVWSIIEQIKSQKDQVLENKLNKRIDETNDKLTELYSETAVGTGSSNSNIDFTIRLRRVGRNFTRIAESIGRIEDKLKRQEYKINQIQSKSPNALSPILNRLVTQIENIKRNLEFTIDDVKSNNTEFVTSIFDLENQQQNIENQISNIHSKFSEQL